MYTLFSPKCNLHYNQKSVMLNRFRSMISRKRYFFSISLIMFICILFTRAITIDHEMHFHLDEPNIFRSSVSLMEKILSPEKTYQVALVYPEGSFVMQVPFHLLAYLLDSKLDSRIWARVASICYYSVGCLIGAACMYRFLGQRIRSVFFYSLLCVFSLYYVEQSRYGTGDPPSFFLLMLLLYACGMFLQFTKVRWLCLAGLCAGALAAIKYPQIYFLSLPFVLLHTRDKKTNKRSILLLVLLSSTLAGFLVLSPSMLVWPGYLTEVISREAKAYMGRWTLYTPLENLLELFIYALLYSDIPFGLLLIMCAVKYVSKAQVRPQNQLQLFFGIWLPLIIIVFAVYNLFAGLLFFRTLNPLFAIGMLYSAWALDFLWDKRFWKPVIAALCTLMLLRSALLMNLLAAPNQSEVLRMKMLQDEHWNVRKGTVVLGNIGGECPGPDRYYPMDYLRWVEFPELDEAEFAITASMEYGYVKRPLLKNKITYPITDKWDQFVLANQSSHLATAYPQWYYSLFGYWLPASSGALFELPNMQLYFHP